MVLLLSPPMETKRKSATKRLLITPTTKAILHVLRIKYSLNLKNVTSLDFSWLNVQHVLLHYLHSFVKLSPLFLFLFRY